MTFFSNMAYLEREESSGEISHKSFGLRAMEATKAVTQLVALTAKSSLQRDVMDMHRLLCHAHQGILRDTAKVAGITPTKE